MKTTRTFAAVMSCLATGLAFAATPPELVLGENVRLRATTPSGTITVNAAEGTIFDTAWTNDGLVVQWGVSPERY